MAGSIPTRSLRQDSVPTSRRSQQRAVTTSKAYAELNAPLLADVAFADLLELNGAVRFFGLFQLGSTTTFKAGANWKPIEDLRLRVSWAEGFRAPQIGELFGTQTRFDQQLSDPCSSHPGNTAPQNFRTD